MARHTELISKPHPPPPKQAGNEPGRSCVHPGAVVAPRAAFTDGIRIVSACFHFRCSIWILTGWGRSDGANHFTAMTSQRGCEWGRGCRVVSCHSNRCEWRDFPVRAREKAWPNWRRPSAPNRPSSQAIFPATGRARRVKAEGRTAGRIRFFIGLFPVWLNVFITFIISVYLLLGENPAKVAEQIGKTFSQPEIVPACRHDLGIVQTWGDRKSVV